jgi:hypothetical protein
MAVALVKAYTRLPHPTLGQSWGPDFDLRLIAGLSKEWREGDEIAITNGRGGVADGAIAIVIRAWFTTSQVWLP